MGQSTECPQKIVLPRIYRIKPLSLASTWSSGLGIYKKKKLIKKVRKHAFAQKQEVVQEKKELAQKNTLSTRKRPRKKFLTKEGGGVEGPSPSQPLNAYVCTL